MNGNSINDIYVDEARPHLAGQLPDKGAMRNNRYSGYNWIKHSIGNKQSLINDQVNSVIEDSEGDLWLLLTTNGISLYYSKTKQWHFSQFIWIHKQ